MAPIVKRYVNILQALPKKNKKKSMKLMLLMLLMLLRRQAEGGVEEGRQEEDLNGNLVRSDEEGKHAEGKHAEGKHAEGKQRSAEMCVINVKP